MSDAKEILKMNSDGSITVNDKDLQCLISSLPESFKCCAIFGNNRGGKSYAMNVFRKKIENNFSCNLPGFQRRTGSKGVTSDFWMMPVNRKFEKWSFLFCDAEGAFEVGKSAETSAKLLAISATISSCLIINIKQSIDTAELTFFNAFFANIKANNSGKFQKLVFLVRDWGYPDEHKFGLDGGNQYLATLKDESLQKIMSLFTSTQCFLMPSIGYEQVKDAKYCFSYVKEHVDAEFDEFCEKFVKEVIMNIDKQFKTNLLKARLHQIVKSVNENERPSLYDIQRANDEILILREQSEKSALETNEKCKLLSSEINTLKMTTKATKETENQLSKQVQNLEKEVKNVNEMRVEVQAINQKHASQVNALQSQINSNLRRRRRTRFLGISF